jgi:glyoxylase I family protein
MRFFTFEIAFVKAVNFIIFHLYEYFIKKILNYMLNLKGLHHVAIICSNYTLSKHFYTEILGLKILQEVFRLERNSYKLDLAVNGVYQIELFSFPDPPERLSHPEGKGLRHLAFEVDNLSVSVAELTKKGIITEEIRIDEYSGKRFVFFSDPDGLPIELYES